MNDEQRTRWKETGVFPIEAWTGTPPVCPMPTLEELRSLAAAVPDRIRLSGWYLGKSAFGHQYLYADNFQGMGRQWVCDFPTGKSYFGSLAEYVAAVHPRAVLRLLDRIAVLEATTQPSAKALTDEAIMEIADKHGWVIKQTGRMEWLVCSTNTPSNMLALARALLAAEHPSEGTVRGASIKASMLHDAGAYARCSYCDRYSDNPKSLSRESFPCDCGELHGWSGSFVKPTAESKWSEADVMPHAAIAKGESQ